MRVLLSDGSGLTGRQVATYLGRAGHFVGTLNAQGVTLSNFTRWVRARHTVTPLGKDPFGWLSDCLAVLRQYEYDVLIPTQEQVAILSLRAPEVAQANVALAVPPFSALAHVQDKISAYHTLDGLGLPVPTWSVARNPHELTGTDLLPGVVKLPIGTASRGVYRADDRASLTRVANEIEASGGFDPDGVVIQRAEAGPLAMIQAVFDHGSLIASHANLRVKESDGGGAAVKRSITLPVVTRHLQQLGLALGWHGALALDAILTANGPRYIDVNPRIVEPGNAWFSGVDLSGALLATSLNQGPRPQPPGREAVTTRQSLLAVLSAAGGGRWAVLREIGRLATRVGYYRGSTEELTPMHGDPLAVLPVVLAAALVLIRPSRAEELVGGAIRGYSLDAEGWRRIVAASA